MVARIRNDSSLFINNSNPTAVYYVKEPSLSLNIISFWLANVNIYSCVLVKFNYFGNSVNLIKARFVVEFWLFIGDAIRGLLTQPSQEYCCYCIKKIDVRFLDVLYSILETISFAVKKTSNQVTGCYIYFRLLFHKLTI